MKLRRVLLIFTVMLSAVIFADGVYVLSLLAERHNGGYVRDQPGPFSPPDVSHFESSVSAGRPVNLLVMGLDNEKSRTDVILLFNFDPDRSKLNILSIARDTRVFERGKFSKINALYSAGGEELVAREITALTGLPVNYYLTMDFRGFRKIVDTLGGVEFRVPFRMKYDDPDQNLHINLRKGTQLLDGDAAEQLVRYRKGNRAGQGYIDGDIGRIRMQQDFIRCLIRQKLNLKYLSRMDDIFGILRRYVKTNMGLTDIAAYLGSAGRINADEVKTFTLPGDSAMKGDVWYFIHDEAATEELIKANFFD